MQKSNRSTKHLINYKITYKNKYSPEIQKSCEEFNIYNFGSCKKILCMIQKLILFLLIIIFLGGYF